MGILAELEKLNPETLLADLEAAKTKITEYEGRIAGLETSLGTLLTTVQTVIPFVETAFPQATPEITAALAILKGLSLSSAPSVPATPSTPAVPTK